MDQEFKMTDNRSHREFPLRPNFMKTGMLLLVMTIGVCVAAFLFFNPNVYGDDSAALRRIGQVLFGFMTFVGPLAVFLLSASSLHFWLYPRRIAFTADSIVVPSPKRFGFNGEETVVPFREIETIQMVPAFGDWLVVVRYRAGKFMIGSANFPSRQIADDALTCLADHLAKTRVEAAKTLRSLCQRSR